MTIYVILGTNENVYQDKIDSDFTPHPQKEIITAFADYAEANKFILSQKLSKPQRKSYGDTSHYKGGFYDMEIQSTELNLDHFGDSNEMVLHRPSIT